MASFGIAMGRAMCYVWPPGQERSDERVHELYEEELFRKFVVMNSEICTDAVPINSRSSNRAHQHKPPPLSTQSTDEKDDSPLSSPSSPTSDKFTSHYQVPQVVISHSKYIHIGNTTVFNTSKTVVNQKCEVSNAPSKLKRFERTQSIDYIISSNEEVSHRYMHVISKNLGEGWKDVFRSMGYKDGFIETMMETYKLDGVSEVIYQLLLDWVRNPEDDETRTIGELCTILWNAGKCELVKQLVEINKNSQKRKN